ncbi:hypothetical protein D0B32_23475 [Paraburkholderia sp. DHOC27]|nr:hypothetical protein D0B32_23475 [Paraburkholderia sp. DHOC27]
MVDHSAENTAGNQQKTPRSDAGWRAPSTETNWIRARRAFEDGANDMILPDSGPIRQRRLPVRPYEPRLGLPRAQAAVKGH